MTTKKNADHVDYEAIYNFHRYPVGEEITIPRAGVEDMLKQDVRGLWVRFDLAPSQALSLAQALTQAAAEGDAVVLNIECPMDEPEDQSSGWHGELSVTVPIDLRAWHDPQSDILPLIRPNRREFVMLAAQLHKKLRGL